MRVAHRQEDLAEPGHQLGDVLRALRAGIPRARPATASIDVDVGQDDLERALEDLGLAPDVQVVARLERPRQPLGRVPEPGPDAAGLVAELEVKIEIPLAIGPELLVGDEEHFFDGVAMVN